MRIAAGRANLLVSSAGRVAIGGAAPLRSYTVRNLRLGNLSL